MDMDFSRLQTPPLGKRPNVENPKKNSRGLGIPRCVGCIFPSLYYSPPLGKRPNFRIPAEIRFPRVLREIWISQDCNSHLRKRPNSGTNQEKFAKINPFPENRPYIFFSMLYRPLGKRPNFREPAEIRPKPPTPGG